MIEQKYVLRLNTIDLELLQLKVKNVTMTKMFNNQGNMKARRI